MFLRALRRYAFAPALVAPIVLAFWGCSAGADTAVFGTTGATSGETGAQGSGGSAGSGAVTTGSSSGDGGNIGIDGGNADGPLDDGSACAATSAEAELIPLDMVILLDRSGSMYGSNWDGATAALKTFVNDPASAGINVGIIYFPIDNPPNGNDCDYHHYDDLVVPVGPLPGNAAAMVQSIDAEDPNGGDTPMYGALEGTLFAATKLQDANATHKVIVVFASDGDPNSCPGNQNDIPVIAALAQSALNYNGVQTYVIAISGSIVANLNQIAAAGGTTQAYDVTQNIQQFSQKMAEIRSAALACDFVIPPPPDSEELDPTKVNVSYTPGGQGMGQTLPHADNYADCGNQPGWYYDNNANPTKIILCPASCAIVQADSQAQISVLFGCKTEIN